MLVSEITAERATLIVLALEGWRLEHGTLPKTLAELSPSWFAQVPVDPLTGKPFQYYPEGVSEPIAWHDNTIAGSTRFVLPAHRPFVEGAYMPSDSRSTFRVQRPTPDRHIFTIPEAKRDE